MSPPHVFLSHASEDRSLAELTRAALEGEGLTCWMAPDCIPPGASYSDAIMEAIAGSRLFVLLFSPESNRSPHVLREVERAVNRSLPILAVKTATFRLSPGMAYLLSVSQWLDATEAPFADSLERLVSLSRGLVSNELAAATSARELPAELAIGVTTQSAFELDVHALFLSRGRLESSIKGSRLETKERRVRVAQLELFEVTLPGRPQSPRLILYPKALQTAFTGENFERAVYACFSAAQLAGATRVAVVPTGSARGFSPLQALRCALRAYAEYLREPPGGRLPTIMAFKFPVPAYLEADYERNQLFAQLRQGVSQADFLVEHYEIKGEEMTQSPPGLELRLTRRPTPA